jgi:hypothetical protein
LQYLQCKDAKLKVLNLKSIIAPQKEIEDIWVYVEEQEMHIFWLEIYQLQNMFIN